MSRDSSAAAPKQGTLFGLALNEEWDEVNALLDKKDVDVNERNEGGTSFLTVATAGGRIKAVTKILERDPVITDHDLESLKSYRADLQKEIIDDVKDILSSARPLIKALCDSVIEIIKSSKYIKSEIYSKGNDEISKELEGKIAKYDKSPVVGSQKLGSLRPVDIVKYSLTVKTQDEAGLSSLLRYFSSYATSDFSSQCSSAISKSKGTKIEAPMMGVLAKCSAGQPLSPKLRFEGRGLRAGRVATNLELALSSNDSEEMLRLIKHEDVHNKFSSQRTPIFEIASKGDLDEKVKMNLVKAILGQGPTIPLKEEELLAEESKYPLNTAKRFLNNVLDISSQLKSGCEIGTIRTQLLDKSIATPEELIKYAITVKSHNKDGTVSSALDFFDKDSEQHLHLLQELSELTLETSRDQGGDAATGSADAGVDPGTAPRRTEEELAGGASPLSGTDSAQTPNL